MSGWSGCVKTSGGRGPCCVMCCSTSRMAEPVSSGSANRLQCETLKLPACCPACNRRAGEAALPGDADLCHHSQHRSCWDELSCIIVHLAYTAISAVFLVFNGSLLLSFSSYSLGVIQVLPIILPFKKTNLECCDSALLADDPGVRIVNKSSEMLRISGTCVCGCVYKQGRRENNTFLNDCRDAGITPSVTTITVSGTTFLSTFPHVLCPLSVILHGSRHINANSFSCAQK